MKHASAVQRPQANSWEGNVSLIMDQLDLSILWDLPAILLVIGSTQGGHAAAEAVLMHQLECSGQKVTSLCMEDFSHSDLRSLLAKFHSPADHVYFINGVNSRNQKLLAQLGAHSDILSQGNLRMVIWLSPTGLVDLAWNAPQIWERRQHVVDFTDNSSLSHAIAGAIASVWEDAAPASLDTLIESDEKENSRLGMDAEVARARQMLTLGILHWRKGELDSSVDLLQKTIQSALVLEDHVLEAECCNAIALVYFAQGRHNDAIAAYRQALRVAPDQFLAWNNLGNLCLRISRNDEALLAFQKALQYNPKDAVAWEGLGTVYDRLGYMDDALQAFQKAVQFAPLLAHAWADLGDACQKTGRDADAISAYQKAADLNQSLVHPWLRLAEIHTRHGRHLDAIKDYQRVLAINPQEKDAWNALGLALLKTNAYQDAIHAFLSAIGIDHKFGWAFANLALAYGQQGMVMDAIESCKVGLAYISEDADKVTIFERLANFYRSINDYGSAMQAYQSADQLTQEVVSTIVLPEVPILSLPQVTPVLEPETAAKEKSVDLYQTPVDVRLVVESPDESIAPPAWIFSAGTAEPQEGIAITDSDNLFWNDGMFNFMSEHAASSNGKKEEPMNTQELFAKNSTRQAASSLGFSEDSQPRDPFENREEITESRDPEVWNKKGNIHFQNGEYEQAISAYNKAIELNRSFGWPYVNLAHTYLAQSKYAEAILLYQKSTNLLVDDREKANAWNNLGNIYRHLNDYDKALVAYQKADELDPENAGRSEKMNTASMAPNSHSAQVWLELGNLFFKSGSYTEAADAYGNSIKIDPSSGWAHSNLAMSLVFQGKYKEAVSLYQASIDLFSSPRDKAVTWNRLGNVYRRMNDEDNARKAYQSAVLLSNEKMSLLTRTRFSLLGNCYSN